jgi:hypothetical protein
MTTPTTAPKTKARKKAGTGQGATRRHSATSPESIDTRERDQQALQLRRSGVTWDAIATQLRYSSPGHAYNQVTKLMREYPREDVEAYRDLLIDRQELVIRVLTPKVLKADTWAIDRYLKACEQLARLTGANRPERIEVTAAQSELDAAYRELMAEMNARAGGAPVPPELPADTTCDA